VQEWSLPQALFSGQYEVLPPSSQATEKFAAPHTSAPVVPAPDDEEEAVPVVPAPVVVVVPLAPDEPADAWVEEAAAWVPEVELRLAVLALPPVVARPVVPPVVGSDGAPLQPATSNPASAKAREGQRRALGTRRGRVTRAPAACLASYGVSLLAKVGYP
jgi:hypothetical protein